MEVTILNNPLKIITVKGTFTVPETNSSNDIFVNIVPSYMDLTKGVWNLSLDSYAIKTNEGGKSKLDCVLEVSTNLVSAFEYQAGKSNYNSFSAPLGHMFGFGTTKSFDHFEKKWFTIDENASGNQLQLYIKQKQIFKVPKLNISYEITILFQRIK